MKVYYYIASMSPSEDVLHELTQLYPEGLHAEHWFRVWIPLEDPRVAMLSRCLERWGYHRWSGRGKLDYACEYNLRYVREYEPRDLEQAEYLMFDSEVMDGIVNAGRDKQGRLLVERPTIRNARKQRLDFIWSIWSTLVEQKTHDLLLQASLLHLAFKPTVLCKGRGLYEERRIPIPWEQFKPTGPWWELSSDLVLPRLSPKMDLRDKNGNDGAPPDRIRGCSTHEGFYAKPEFHYRRSDLRQVEPFDVGMTFENFGFPHDLGYEVIVSQRFYAYCQEKGLRARWQPVRVDEE